jgi:hypothetical protein
MECSRINESKILPESAEKDGETGYHQANILLPTDGYPAMKFAFQYPIMVGFLGCFTLGWLFCGILKAQLPTGWKQHDWDRPRPAVVDPGPEPPIMPAPSDAVVLFDGSNLDQWRAADKGPAKWIIKDGAMEPVPNGGYIYTAESFGDCQLHIEWASPTRVSGSSQGRGNSGVFLQGLFEVQILDSFDNQTYADGQAGAIYGQYPPLVNASRKPGQWQTYDIIFRRPHYSEAGELVQPARLTVLHNGVLIQDNVKPVGPTSWIQFHQYTPTPERLPISLQDHGNPVRFRNIWIRELAPESIEPPSTPYDPVVVELTSQQIERIVGSYSRKGGGTWEISYKNGKLWFHTISRPLEMIPHSDKEFGLRYTAGSVDLVYDDEGFPMEISFTMGGSTSHGTRSR